jgi:PAS domain S-box-containing protein
MHIAPARAICALACVTVLLVAGSVTFLLWENRKSEVERERAGTVAFAEQVSKDTEQSLERLDMVLRGIQERMLTPFGSRLALESEEVHLLLRARIFSVRPEAELFVIDAGGQLLNSSRSDHTPGESFATARYLTQLVEGAEGLVVDAPKREAMDTGTLHLARALKSAEGELRGVAVVAVKVVDLQRLFASKNGGTPRTVSLLSDDGGMVASSEAVSAGRVRIIDGPGQVGERESYVLGGGGSFPLWVRVPVREAEALATWRDNSVALVLGGLALCAAVIAAAWLLVREVNRQALLQQALRDANDRYHKTIESVMDAIVGVDGSHNIILFNPAAQRMFGLDKSQAIGKPLALLLPERARAGHALPMDRFMCAPREPRPMAPDVEVTGLRADGSEFPMEATISRTMVEGMPQLTAVLRDITQRRRAEDEMHEMNRQLRSLSASLQEVREQERARIALELHDDLGQQLTGLKLELSWLTARLKDGRAPAPDEIGPMRQQLDTAIASVRRIATELRPPILDDLGFGEAVSWHVAEFARRSGLKCTLDLQAQTHVADDVVATALFRIVQESLTNVVRHAEATSVHVKLVNAGKLLVLSVTDDGAGFAPDARAGKGIGLVSIRERAMSLGGHLDVRGAPGAGTTITVSLPLARPLAQRSKT